MKNSQAVKKVCSPKAVKAPMRKRYEIKGGGQEMAVIIVQWKKIQ